MALQPAQAALMAVPSLLHHTIHDHHHAHALRKQHRRSERCYATTRDDGAGRVAVGFVVVVVVVVVVVAGTPIRGSLQVELVREEEGHHQIAGGVLRRNARVPRGVLSTSHEDVRRDCRGAL